MRKRQGRDMEKIKNRRETKGRRERKVKNGELRMENFEVKKPARPP
jgi:hypothetical protein